MWGEPYSIGEDIDDDLLVPADAQEIVMDVSVGTDYTLIVLSDGSAIVAGYIAEPDEYQGHFACGCTELSPGLNPQIDILEVRDLNQDLVSAPEFKKVFAGVESFEGSGRMHSVFIDVDGNVYAAGNNDKGQLCLDDVEYRIYPSQIELPGDEKAVSAAVGGEFTFILSDAGKLYGCGSNELGQLGLGPDVLETLLPDDGNGLTGVLSVSAGRDFALIRTEDGLYVMGDNTFGTLAHGGLNKHAPAFSCSLTQVILSFLTTTF